MMPFFFMITMNRVGEKSKNRIASIHLCVEIDGPHEEFSADLVGRHVLCCISYTDRSAFYGKFKPTFLKF